jgi:hypothetical protein
VAAISCLPLQQPFLVEQQVRQRMVDGSQGNGNVATGRAMLFGELLDDSPDFSLGSCAVGFELSQAGGGVEMTFQLPCPSCRKKQLGVQASSLIPFA